MAKETQENLVELGNRVVGQIELPSVNITPFLGMKTKIEKIEEYEGNFGYYIKVISESLGVAADAKDKDGNPIDMRASRIFGLQQDADQNIGWGEKTVLGTFLKKMKVKHYNELVGKEVITQSVTSQKDGKDYISFN